MSNYDVPAVEEKWCEERRGEVIAYLEREGVKHGRVGEWPAWHVAPYISVWAIESRKSPESVGWWVICGDLPTDYVSSERISHPREVVRAIAECWSKLVPYLERGEEHPEVSLRTPQTRAELAPLLKARSKLLAKWVEDDSVWSE
jgi:hypothetical protein